MSGHRITWVFSLALGTVLVANTAAATNYTWTTTTSGVTAGSGTWSTANANWTSGGNAVDWINSNSNAAIFAGADASPDTYVINTTGLTAATIGVYNSGYMLVGAGTVSLNTAQSTGTYTSAPSTLANNAVFVNTGKAFDLGSGAYVFFNGNQGFTAMTFLNGGVSGSTLNIESGASFVRTNTGGNNGGLAFSGTGAVNVYGTLTFAPTSSSGGGLLVSRLGTDQITFNVNSGGLVTTSSNATGSNFQNDSLAVSYDSGGTGASGFCVLNINPGGAVNVAYANATAGVVIASNSNSVGTLNLNGGTLTAPRISDTGTSPNTGNGVLNFNGGLLVANTSTTSFVSGLTSAYVQNGGTISNAGFNITIVQPLLTNPLLGGGADGGLAFTGAGATTLTGSNAYNGLTSVNNGSLLLNGGALLSTGSVSVASGALFGGAGSAGSVGVVSGGTLQGGQSSSAGTLSLAALGFSGGNLFVGGVGPSNTAAPVISVAGALTTNANTITVGVGGNLLGTTVGTVYELLGYGSLAGNGTSSFTLGTPLPQRATGTLSSSGNLIDLTITSTGDFLHWTGSQSTAWDTTSANWHLNSTGATTTFINGNATNPGDIVVFDDQGGGTVSIASNVFPASVAFSNTNSAYTLQGAGGIYGATGLTVNGPGKVTINNANGYTGTTTVNGGTLQTSGGNTPTGDIGLSSLIVVNSGATIAVSGSDNSFVGASTSGTRQIQINAGGLIVNALSNGASNSTAHLNALVLNGGTLSSVASDTTYGSWNPDYGISTPGNGSTSYITGGNIALTQSGGVVFNVGTGDTLSVSSSIAHVTGSPDNGLIKQGAGLLILGSVGNNYTSLTTVSAGTLALNGTSTGGGIYDVSNSTAAATVNVNPGAILTITGGGSGTTVGGGGMNLGIASSAVGIANQSGGTVALTNGSWNLELGDVNNSYGCYNMSGGSLFANEVEIGNNGYGLYNQTGGSVTVANYLLLSRAGSAAVTTYGVANVSGGQLIFTGNNNFSADIFPGSGAQLLGAVFTISNTGFVSLGGNNVQVGSQNAGENLNLNGGTLQVSGIKYNTATGSINFNGGLMLASSNGAALIANNGNMPVYVNSGGGTINNNGLNVSVPAALLAPSGSGVSSIQVSGTGFSSPPLVYITGGNGNYATAVATINSSGSLTGVTITNPGNNYTFAPTLTLYGGGGTLLSSTINLSALNGGGMAFQGSGTTALTGANTYTGPTSVSGGVFLINGSQTGGGNYAIAAGATLGGSGSITGGGTVTLSAGANLAPGNNATTGNVGTLTLPALAIGGGGTAYFDISGTNSIPGSGADDQVSVAGNISLSGSTSVFVNVVDNGGAIQTSGTSSYALFSYASGGSGSVSGFTANSFKLSDTGILNSRQIAQFVNNTSADQIDLNIIGVAGNLTWIGSNAASWDTSSVTTNWFNSNDNANDKFVNGDNVTFAAASAGPPVVAGSGAVAITAAVAPGSVTVSGGNYTFSGTGKITGATMVTVQSGAALVIANTNDYTGGTQVQGLLTLGTNNALPTVNTGLSISNGTLDLAGYNQQIDGATGYGGLITTSRGNSTLTYANSASTSYFSGTIADTSPGGGMLSLTVSAGTLNVTSGATNYFGATTVSGSGELVASSIPNSTTYSVGPAAVLSINNANAAYGANYSNSGSVTFGNSSGTIAMINPTGGGITSTNGAELNVSAGTQGFGGSAVLYKSTAGTLVLAGNSTYTGGTTFNSGTIQAAPGSSLPNGPGVGDFAWTNPANSAVLDLNGQNISIGQISQPNASNSNVITNSASGAMATLTVGSNGDTTTFGGVLQNGAGTLALAIAGGALTLTNTNTYTGGTMIGGGGTLSIPHSYSLPYGTVGFTDVGGTLSTGFPLTVPSLNLTTSGTLYAAVSSASLTITGSLLQVGGGTPSSVETLDLTGVSTFAYSNSTGAFHVGGSVMVAANTTAGATGTLLMAATNTITAASFGVADNTGYNGPNNNIGTVYLGQKNTINASLISVDGASKGLGLMQFQSTLTANPTLVLRDSTGSGRAALLVGYNSSNYYSSGGTIDLVTGVTGTSVLDALISGGTIGEATGASSTGGISTGAFLMGGGTLNAQSLALGVATGECNTTGIFSVNGGSVIVGTLTMGQQSSTGVPTTSFTLDGGGRLSATSIPAGAGTQTFNWNNGTIANYDVSGSTTGLTISIPSITLASTGTHTLWIDAGQTGTVNASINGGGGSVDLTKDGPGTAILTQTNPYTGATNVVNGTLKLSGTADVNSSTAVNVNGGSFINDSSVASLVSTVNLNSGVLGGTGTFSNAAITVASSPSNIVAGGDSGAGTLTVNSLAFSGSGQIDVAFGASLLNATTLTVNGAARSVVIQNAGGYPLAIGEYPLVSYSGSIGGTGSAAFVLGALPPRTLAHLDFSNPGVVDYDLTGTDHPIWTGSASSTWSTATISSPKNWTLAIAGTATDFLTGDNVVFNDNAHTGNVQISAANVQPASATFNNSSLVYTITGPYGIADYSASQASTVTLGGSGLVVFATSNSYTGGTTINGGTLQLGNGAVNGSIAGNVNVSGVLAFNPATPSTFAGAINGGGAVEISGSSQLFLTGISQYAGGTTINGGILNINADAALGTAPSSPATNITFNHNGTLQFGANNISLNANRTIVLNGVTATFDTYGNAATIAGAIVDGSGPGAVVVAGSGELTLTGANTYSGTTYVNAATLSIGNGGSGEFLASPAIVDNSALVFNHADALTYAGNISGSGSLTKAAAGTLVLAGFNNYTGLTTISGGSLDLPSTSALTGGGNISFQGGTLVYSATGATVLTGAVVNSGASTMNFNIAAGTLEMSGNLGASNSGGLLVTGPGTLVVSQGNSYSGTTQIGTNQGNGQYYAEVLATASQALGTGSISFDNGGNGTRGQLLLSNNISLNNPITLSGRNTTGGNASPINAAIDNISGNNTLSGGITLQVGGTYILQSDSGLLTISGGTAITSGASGSRNVTLQGNGNGLISGMVINGSATGGLSLTTAGSGTWTISNTANAYTGGSNVNSGVMQFTQTAAMPAAGTVSVASSAILAVNAGGPGEFSSAASPSGTGSIGGLLAGIGGQGAPVTWASGAILGIDATNAPGGLTYSGSIGNTANGPLGLAELGSGTLTLSGMNTYTGGTDVLGSATLIVSSPSAIDASGAGTNLSVGSASLLAEFGTVFSPVSPADRTAVAPAGLAPVPEPGTLALLAAAAAVLVIRLRRKAGIGS